jgi:nitric oxide reductase subunit C
VGLSPAVVHGKELGEHKNGMGGHTLLGEGAYSAPVLTKVVERRGAAWIKIFIKDPPAMFPGQRQMPKYGFSDAEIDDLVAFLTWVGNIDTNGFPMKPDLAPSPPSAPVNAAASVTSLTSVTSATTPATPPAMFTSVCQACHAVNGKGGVVGPALDGVKARKSRAELDIWLKDPQAVKPGTAMPNLALSDAVRAEIVDYLLTL